MVCWMPGTPTDLPHAGTGPSTPAFVRVLTSDASARISPVLTSMTTAVPSTAPVAASSRARARSATNCSDVSSVNSRPTPGLARVMTVDAALGRLTPELDTNARVTPVRPASRDWYLYSSPAEPAPCALVPPSTDVAIGPLGYVRTDELWTTMPGK